jgi:hypothetical protein
MSTSKFEKVWSFNESKQSRSVCAELKVGMITEKKGAGTFTVND